MLRAPDIRLGGIDTEMCRADVSFDRTFERPDRGLLCYARRGDFELELLGGTRSPVLCREGTVVGFESGRGHRWRALCASADGSVELFTSSIPRRQGVLQRLPDGMIVVPPEAAPNADRLKLAIELHLLEFETASSPEDESVIRRCAEICLIEFVRYARAIVASQRDIPVGLEHDEALLQAWAAYFADPQRRWTLKALAEAAGLGRTVFAERFRKVFGAPPLKTLTAMRLEQAEAILRDTRAPLIEVAFTVGYNSEAAFVRAFHRQYGIPPGRFRETLKPSSS